MSKSVNFVLLGALLAVSVASPISAQRVPNVEEVQATTDLSAVQNPDAIAYWKDIDADIEAAVLLRLADRVADTGLTVSIDIQELELANAFEASLGLDKSLLAGRVNVTDPKDNSNFKSFDVVATSEQVVPLMPAGTDITILPADSPQFYAALIQAFADGVVSNIDN